MARAKKVEKKINYGAVIPAIVLISLGLIFLLSDLGIIAFNAFYIVLIVGLIFIAGYVISKVWGLLIPGVIITATSLILLAGAGDLWYLWPGAVGLAFITVYLTKQKDTEWAIIPGAILVAIAVISSFEYYTNINTWAVLLIAAGAYLIYKNYQN
jgi:hypothetical protein